MKTNFKNYNIYTLLYLITIITYLSSCSKNNNLDEGNTKNSKLNFKIGKIEEFKISEDEYSTDNDNLKASKSLAKNSLNSQQVLTNRGLDIILSNENSDLEKSDFNKIKSSIKNNHKAENVLLADVVYRIILYDSANKFIGSIEGTSKKLSSTPFEIWANNSYKWIAYSYNSKQSLPPLSNNNSPILSKSENFNKDLLYASGSFVATEGENFINIVFKHYTNLVSLKVDSRGMFGKIKNLSVSVPLANGKFKSADFDLLKGEFITSTFENYESIFIPNEGWEIDDNGYSRNYHFYQINTEMISTLPIKIEPNMSIDTDLPNKPRVFVEAININNTLKNNVTPRRGYKNIVRIQFIESGIPAGNHLLARGNLYMGADGEYKFRSYPDNYYSNVNEELWNFGVLSTNYTDRLLNRAEAKDPCFEVYPKGTWRLGNNVEFYGDSKEPSTSAADGSDYNDTFDLNRKLLIRTKINPLPSDPNTLSAYGYENTIYFTLPGYRDENGNIVRNANFTTYYSSSTTLAPNTNPSSATFRRYVYRIQQVGSNIGGLGSLGDYAYKGTNIRCIRSIKTVNN